MKCSDSITTYLCVQYGLVTKSITRSEYKNIFPVLNMASQGKKVWKANVNSVASNKSAL